MSEKKLRVLFLGSESDAQAQAVRKWAGERAEFFFEEAFNKNCFSEIRPDIVLLTRGYLDEGARFIEEAKSLGIPSLFLQDGILEWRCQYENPLFGSGGGPPQHQPVFTDKIGCIGHQSARQIAAWGNTDKVEITGMPRLDSILERSDYRSVSRPGKTILVMTAQKPWFDEAQKPILLQSLKDLKDALLKESSVKVIWRLTREAPDLIGVRNGLDGVEIPNLPRAIELSDAVITTPSTAGLESMLMSRPVAFLDYTNSPRFFPTVWSISAKEHFSSVIQGLLNPSAAQMAYQNDILNDVLQNVEPASKKVYELMVKMAEIARGQRERAEPLSFPPSLLETTPVYVSYLPSLACLYPGIEIFSETHSNRLHALLSRAQKDNEFLRMKLRTRSLGYWIHLGGHFLLNRVKAWRSRKS